MTQTESGNAQMRDAPLLLGRYRPLGLLAKGGSSLVYRGHDTHLGRDVAIKLFAAGGAPEIARFHDELRVLAELSHHGVVSILDAGVDESTPSDPRPFIVMELVRGETLRSILATRELTTRRIGEIVFEVAEALEYVHARGVIHRDITPSNIMIVDYGTTFSRPRARLTDFGIAVDAATVPEHDGTTTGTAAYLSPEQVRGEAVTSAVDIYSLGLVLLEGFTRRIAFPGDPIQSATSRLGQQPPQLDTLSPPWRDLVIAMTAQDPADRPTAAEVATVTRRGLRDARHKKARKNER